MPCFLMEASLVYKDEVKGCGSVRNGWPGQGTRGGRSWWAAW